MDRVFDETYLNGLRARDPAVEEDLVRFFTKPLWLKLRVRLRSPDLIDDVCQETFLRVFAHFRAGKTLEKADRLPAFVHTVCNNVAFEMLRAHTRHDQIPEGHPDPIYLGRTPEATMVTLENKALVERVLAELPERDRRILQMIFIEEIDKDEICERMGVDRSYLRVLVHRARHRFRDVVAGPGPWSQVPPGGGSVTKLNRNSL